MYYIEVADSHDMVSCIGFVNVEERDIVYEILFEFSDVSYIERYDVI